jgi:acetate kinase
MNIYVNKNANDNIGYGHDLKEGIITTDTSKIPVYVIPTDEEVMIVRDCYRLVKEANNN